MNDRNENLPLVSIMIPNYNYGRYLEQCLESILNQTYPNIEVSFSDNNSTDDSFEIAYRYRKKFLEKGIWFHLNDNKYNLGGFKNAYIAESHTEGDFIHDIASDDAAAPTFIERCMDIFIKYPSVCSVITHREEMDEKGKVSQSPPFFNTDFIIDGESMAAVYMMAGIAIPGQRIFRRCALNRNIAAKNKSKQIRFQIAGDWFYNFIYAMVGDVAYIKEPLFQYRVHSGSESNMSERNLSGIFEHYQLINTFKTISEDFGMTKPSARYNEAVEKLGGMCLRYALKMLKNGWDDIALRYLKLAPVFKSDIENDTIYKDLLRCVNATSSENREIITSLGTLTRTVSYDPPEGYISL